MSLNCNNANEYILQPSMLFDLIGVKNIEEANKVFSVILTALFYLPKGVRLETSTIALQKLSDDLIFIDSDLEFEDVLGLLNEKKLIKIPI